MLFFKKNLRMFYKNVRHDFTRTVILNTAIHSTFFDFLHRVAVAERLKINSNDFFWEKFCTGFLGQEMAQNEFLVL